MYRDYSILVKVQLYAVHRELADPFQHWSLFTTFFKRRTQQLMKRAGSVSPKIMKYNVNEAKKVLGGHGRVTVLFFEVKADFGSESPTTCQFLPASAQPSKRLR